MKTTRKNIKFADLKREIKNFISTNPIAVKWDTIKNYEYLSPNKFIKIMLSQGPVWANQYIYYNPVLVLIGPGYPVFISAITDAGSDREYEYIAREFKKLMNKLGIFYESGSFDSVVIFYRKPKKIMYSSVFVRGEGTFWRRR